MAEGILAAYNASGAAPVDTFARVALPADPSEVWAPGTLSGVFDSIFTEAVTLLT